MEKEKSIKLAIGNIGNEYLLQNSRVSRVEDFLDDVFPDILALTEVTTAIEKQLRSCLDYTGEFYDYSQRAPKKNQTLLQRINIADESTLVIVKEPNYIINQQTILLPSPSLARKRFLSIVDLDTEIGKIKLYTGHLDYRMWNSAQLEEVLKQVEASKSDRPGIVMIQANTDLNLLNKQFFTERLKNSGMERVVLPQRMNKYGDLVPSEMAIYTSNSLTAAGSGIIYGYLPKHDIPYAKVYKKEDRF